MPRIRSGAALATLVVASALLTGCQSVKDESVEIADPANAYVVSGGAERAAASGDKLGKGDRVLTRAGGRVTLVVRERRVVLGADTVVTVPDGATVDLANGTLLVDHRRGPGVTVNAGDTTVDDIGDGAVRVEKAYSVQVAALSAGARVRTRTGPRLDLDELFQVGVAGRSLPRAGAPLQLRHDAWEKQAIPGVLADDTHLNDLAGSLKGPGAPVIPAVYSGNANAPELVLADAIGRAAAKDEPGRRSAASRARLLRGEGGSWGVVSHLLDASVVDVGTALSQVLTGVPASAPDGTPSATSTPGGVFAGGTPPPGVTPSPSPSASRPKPPRPSGSGEPTEEPTESQTPGTVESLLSALPTPLLPIVP